MLGIHETATFPKISSIDFVHVRKLFFEIILDTEMSYSKGFGLRTWLLWEAVFTVITQRLFWEFQSHLKDKIILSLSSIS